MTFRLKCYLLYSSHIMTPYSQSFCMSSINGSKKTSMPLPASLGPNMRVVNKRYFHFWHNHRGRLNMDIITGHVPCEFLISLNGYIPFVLSPNLIFLGSLEKSSWWAISKIFHCLPSTGCRNFLSIFWFTFQSNNSVSLGLENIRFKWSVTGRYHITREGTFLSLDPSMSWSVVAFFLFRPCHLLLFLLESTANPSLLSFCLYRLGLHIGHLSPNSCSFLYKMKWFEQAWIFSIPKVNGQMSFFDW
jgi:hypothetical protein